MLNNEYAIQSLMNLAHSPIRNYVIPGLTSQLLGSSGPNGCVRLFTCTRDHQERISPHSHRYNFVCIVLRGTVTQRLWRRQGSSVGADSYQETRLVYAGNIGEYKRIEGDVSFWNYVDYTYREGESYEMKADEVHSIQFSRNVVVLFVEGPQVSQHSIVLDPVVNGEVIPISTTQPWMFQHSN